MSALSDAIKDRLVRGMNDAWIADAVALYPDHAEGCMGDCAEHGCPVQRQEWVGTEGVAQSLTPLVTAIRDEVLAEFRTLADNINEGTTYFMDQYEKEGSSKFGSRVSGETAAMIVQVRSELEGYLRETVKKLEES